MNRLFKSLLPAVPVLALAAGPAFAAEIQNPAKGWDRLWDELLVDLWVLGGVFALGAIYMMIKYRARPGNTIGNGPKLTVANAIGWVLIPAAVFMADDFFLAAKGWTLFGIYRSVPADALEVKVIGSQWAWNFDYGNGVTTDTLKVPVGKPVVLHMVSDDVVHSFALSDYRVKEDAIPGRQTYLWFIAEEPKKSKATCTMYCGLAHSKMYADVEAVPAAEFHAWMDDQMRHAQAATKGTQG